MSIVKKNVYTVTQVNAYIKNMFVQDYLLHSLFVKGEVSNCKYHSSGHIYFTLKDAKGTMNCVMFAGNRNGLNFRMTEGQRVIVAGTVDVYERDGKYQLYAKQIQLDGIGDLAERYEALKRKLEEQGMFAQEYKRPIPKYIKTLGVVTAKEGAAIHDIINISKRRNPYIQIILYPAIVQGESAAASIVQGIHALEQMNVDVMIVGRGGGSLEDLWAFNEEIVAQAVFDCTVPIISAVGHETDTALTDYVADLRAPTPSAAAELAVMDISSFYEQLRGLQKRLYHVMWQKTQRKRLELQNLEYQLRMRSPESRLREQRTHMLALEDKLMQGMQYQLERKKHYFALLLERMRGLSPLDKLQQGYAVVSKNDKVMKSITQVNLGDEVLVQISDGDITAVVKEKRERRSTDGGKKGAGNDA